MRPRSILGLLAQLPAAKCDNQPLATKERYDRLVMVRYLVRILWVCCIHGRLVVIVARPSAR